MSISDKLDDLPRYSVVTDNGERGTWCAIGREWPADTWLWMRVGAAADSEKIVMTSAELESCKYDLLLVATGYKSAKPKRIAAD